MTRKIVFTLVVLFAASAIFPVFAENNAPAQPTVTTTPYPSGACMQAAVDKRDTAIIAGFDVFSASAKSALTVRKDALKAAWGITNKKERRTALKSAWEAFKKSRKDAARTYKETHKKAWLQFNADAKACKGNAGDEPANMKSEEIGI